MIQCRKRKCEIYLLLLLLLVSTGLVVASISAKKNSFNFQTCELNGKYKTKKYRKRSNSEDHYHTSIQSVLKETRGGGTGASKHQQQQQHRPAKIHLPPLRLLLPLIFAPGVKKPRWLALRHIHSDNKLSALGALCMTCTLGFSFSGRAATAFGRNDNDDGDGDDYCHHSEKMRVGQVISRALFFWRKTGPIIIHYKFTQAWVNRRYKHQHDQWRRDEIYQNLHKKYSPQALDIILNMRGLFVKIGQVLSSRPDFIPKEYINMLSSVQDDVPPWPGKEIIDIVSKSLRRDYNLEFGEIFETFDPIPLGSASIGQVHRATLREGFLAKFNETSNNYNNSSSDGSRTTRDQNQDKTYSGGRDVAIKVMHFNAEDRFRNDLRIFKWLCKVALPGWGPLIAEFERQVMSEFDYRNEAANLKRVKINMASSPYKDMVTVPEPIEALSTKNVLFMELLHGKKLVTATEEKLSSILGGDDTLSQKIIAEKRNEIFFGKKNANANSSKNSKVPVTLKKYLSSQSVYNQFSIPLQLALLVRKQRKILDLLLDVHGHQIFVNGCFNGDPHPGNILELDDGKIGLIDYGQCKILSNDDRLKLSRVVQTLGEEKNTDIEDAMDSFGFRFRYGNKDIIQQIAELFFGSDEIGKKMGFVSPQMYFEYLQKCDPMENIPDAAVFVARTSFLFRGMGALLGQNVNTGRRWAHHATIALLEMGAS